MSADAACVYVDFAGNAGLRRAIHGRFANLNYSCSIGGTHVEQLGGAKDLPGPRATLFFAPAQIKKRHGDWGPAEFGRRLVQAWQAFAAKVSDAKSPWITVAQHRGPTAVEAAYAQVLGGRGDPRPATSDLQGPEPRFMLMKPAGGFSGAAGEGHRRQSGHVRPPL